MYQLKIHRRRCTHTHTQLVIWIKYSLGRCWSGSYGAFSHLTGSSGTKTWHITRSRLQQGLRRGGWLQDICTTAPKHQTHFNISSSAAAAAAALIKKKKKKLASSHLRKVLTHRRFSSLHPPHPPTHPTPLEEGERKGTRHFPE